MYMKHWLIECIGWQHPIVGYLHNTEILILFLFQVYPLKWVSWWVFIYMQRTHIPEWPVTKAAFFDFAVYMPNDAE